MKILFLFSFSLLSVMCFSQELYYSMKMEDYMPPYSDRSKMEEIISRQIFNVNGVDKFKKISPYGRYKQLSITPNSIMKYLPKLRTMTWAQYDKQNPDNPAKPIFLYKAAYTCMGNQAPDTAKLVLFFSTVNLDDNKRKTNEALADMELNQIVLKEMILVDDPPYVPIYEQSNIKAHVYPVNLYTYKFQSIVPGEGKKPELSSVLRTFAQVKDYAERYFLESTELKFKQGAVQSATDLFFNDAGKRMNFSRTTTFNVQTGEKETIYISIDPFNTKLGIHLKTNQLFVEEDFSASLILGPEGKGISLIGNLKKLYQDKAVFQEDKLKSFILNFKQMDEMVFINPFNLPGNIDRYIYTGSFNNNTPDGWGLMHLQNKYEQAFYFGEFKNGIPDGFGYRVQMFLPEDSLIVYPEKIKFGNSAYKMKYQQSAGMHLNNKLLYGMLKSSMISQNGSVFPTYRTSFGDFRTGKLSGESIDCFIMPTHSPTTNYVIHKGMMKDGMLNGHGTIQSGNEVMEGIFENAVLLSGKKEVNKIHYEIGKVIRYNGKKYVIMSKNTNTNTFYLDNGKNISSKDPGIEFTYQMSLHKGSSCQVCMGTGWITESWSNTYAGSTSKQKTYQTGPTGYLLWEKTTTITTAPVTVHSSKTRKCGCGGQVQYKGPKPLAESER